VRVTFPSRLFIDGEDGIGDPKRAVDWNRKTKKAESARPLTPNQPSHRGSDRCVASRIFLSSEFPVV